MPRRFRGELPRGTVGRGAEIVGRNPSNPRLAMFVAGVPPVRRASNVIICCARFHHDSVQDMRMGKGGSQEARRSKMARPTGDAPHEGLLKVGKAGLGV